MVAVRRLFGFRCSQVPENEGRFSENSYHSSVGQLRTTYTQELSLCPHIVHNSSPFCPTLDGYPKKKATIPGLGEFAVRYSLFATAAGGLGLPASNRVQR